MLLITETRSCLLMNLSSTSMPSQQVLPEHLKPKKGRLYKLIQKSQINILWSQNAGLPGACQPSRWAVTLVDVYALGAALGPGKRATATSPSILPVVSGYHTGVVTWRKRLFPSPFSTLILRPWVFARKEPVQKHIQAATRSQVNRTTYRNKR